MRKRFILAFIVIALLGVLYWFYNMSTIMISVVNPGGGTISYSLLNQKTLKATKFTSSSAEVKHRVSKAGYEVMVEQNGSSFFSIITTTGFLHPTAVSARLMPEKARQFVGNNPGLCMTYASNTMYSYACGDLFSNIKTHVPATSSRPTYTVQNSNTTVFGNIEGVAETSQGHLALVLIIGDRETKSNQYAVYNLDGGLGGSSGVFLPGLDTSDKYSITPYKDGFLVYNPSFSKVVYYANLTSRPAPIQLVNPKKTKYAAATLRTQNDTIVRLYVNGQKSGSEIIIDKAGQSTDLSFGKNFADARACGAKLCVLDNNDHKPRLLIYEVNANKARLDSVVSGVKSLSSSGDSVLAIKSNGILDLNVNSGSGHFDYTFGDYKYCGSEFETDSYLICLINNDSRKAAVRISHSGGVNDNIDKKVQQLQSDKNIKDVSAYGNYIFITPDFGSLIFDRASKGYTYDPATVRSVSAEVNGLLTRAGINDHIYTIKLLGL